MRIVVIGCGSWGTAFSRLLADGGHDVTLACRNPEQAQAIRETGHNPRYLQEVDLNGVDAVPATEAPLEGTDLIVLAVPS
jgi:glycerol-3-phosphate dehydrogenase (NAD(P)+)